MTLVAFAAHKRLRGVRSADGDWREPTGSDANAAGVVAGYTVADVGNAVAEVHPTDAHFVTCILRRDGVPDRFQPRLTKPALGWLYEQGFAVSVELLVADLDNPGHAPWSSPAAAIEAAEAVVLALGTVGAYVTTHGLRVLQPLTVGITPEQAEAATRAWYLDLESHGLTPDWACVDWTRHYRLPHVVRDGAPYRSPAVLLGRMRPVAPPAGLAAPRGKRGEPRFQGPVRDVDESPLARAFAAAGWAGQRLGADRRAVRCPWEHEHSGGNTFDSSTILFGASHNKPRGWWFCSHSHCQGRSQRDVIEALPPAARRLVWSSGAAPAAAPAAAEPLDVVSARMVDAIRRAPDGLSLVRAQCGLGKTHAIRQVAAERAGTLGKLHTRTSISVPTNALAMQVSNDLRAAGVPVLRVFGPLSVTRSDGTPECRFHAAGAALVRGGQSVRRELCEGRGRPCQHREDCAAVDGVEGPDDARVVVGSHGLLGELDGAAGKTGLLAVDEPPALLEPVTMTGADILAALAELGRFEARYAAAMAPALTAIRWWVDLTGPVGEPGPLDRAFELGQVDQDLLTTAFEHTGATDAASAVAAAFDAEHRGTAPPIRADESFAARLDPRLAGRLGDASRVLLAVYRAITKPEAASAIIEEVTREKTTTRRMVVTLVRHDLERAVRRDGRCVVLAADAELHAPVLAKAVGYDPPVLAFAAADGAPVQRAILQTSSANRRGWMPHGRLDVSAVARALRGAVDWILESSWTTPVAFVTYPLVEAALAAALGRRAPAWPQAATRTERDAAVAELGPVLARLPAPPELGHYGALRGLDHWKGLDTLVTLGDPWPDLDAMAREIGFLGLEADRDARAEAHARAELEQAHGRLRLVHRTRPARLLHVGRLVPGGWPGGHETRDLPTGRPARDAVDVRPLVEALGGTTAVAVRLGVGRSTVKRWLSGDHAPPVDMVEALAAAAAGRTPSQVAHKPLVTDLSPALSGPPAAIADDPVAAAPAPALSGPPHAATRHKPFVGHLGAPNASATTDDDPDDGGGSRRRRSPRAPRASVLARAAVIASRASGATRGPTGAPSALLEAA